MAEAMVDDTIPCERCNTQINLQDWVGHIVSNYHFILKYVDLYSIHYREYVLATKIIERKVKKGEEII